MSADVSAHEPYLVDFEDFSKTTGDNGASWLSGLRRNAIDCFHSRGFPSAKDEEWKYTSVEPIRKLGLRIPRAGLGAAAGRFDLGDWECDRITFVNGRMVPDRSVRRDARQGYAGSLAEVVADRRDWVEAHLARHADYREHAFRALNTAFINDGAAVYVAPGEAVDKPLHLVFLPAIEASQTAIVHPRNLIVVGDNASVTVVETYAGACSGVYCSNSVTEIVAGENSVVEHYRVQLEPSQAFHVGTVQVHQQRNSTYRSCVLVAGGGLTRLELNTVLDGEGARAELNGLYFATGAMHVDCRTLVEHRKPHTSSRELYKGILDGRARGIFNGKVIVSEDAQKTDAQQANRNLLLSEEAEVNSKPQLEIFANDVRCSHGTTIGQLEEEELFYLRSRGLALPEARRLLVHGFAGEILEGVRIEALRAHLAETVLRAGSGR